MKKLLIFIFISGNFLFFNSLQAAITATQMGMLDFKVDQNLTAADMNGTNDVTAKLQAAVNNARNAYKALFIPSGTYKVSNTINCIYDETASPIKATHIIGSAIQHPLIKIVDNTTSVFNNASSPNAVFEYHSSNSAHSTEWVMQGGIRGVDFDLGAGNAGAVAIYWGCAQHGYVEDININARNAFAGLTSAGGANSIVANVSVTGGQYGMYLHPTTGWNMPESPQNTIVGCTFINQTNVPLYIWGWGGVTMVGISIVTSRPTAIVMDCSTWSAVIQFPFSLNDSKIEFTTPGASNVAISNPLHGTISLRGVYVKGSGYISKNNGDEDLASTGSLTDWNYVNAFNYIDKNPRNDDSGTLYAGTHYDASTTGTQFKTCIKNISVATPPANLITKHIWSSTPSFEDAGAVLITAGSSTTTIQNAINSNTKVCFAKGSYTLTAPLTLKASTILIGCPGYGDCGSIFYYGWVPTSQTWLINTEDNATATTYLMDIATDPGTADYLGSLNWRAGANSIIRDVWFDKSFDWVEKNLSRLYFSGNGGGRVYNYCDDKNFSDPITNVNINHRKVKISGTTQQLTFYGLNLERGGSISGESTFPMCEMTNASNICIYGAKTESYQPYAALTNCNNIFLTNIIDTAPISPTATNLIELYGTSDHIEIANALHLRPISSASLIVKDPWHSNTPNRTQHLGLYYRNFSSYHAPAETTGMKSISESIWNIYPNPTKSVINIKSTCLESLDCNAVVYNMLGKAIKTVQLNGMQSTIDLSSQSNGIYMIVIQYKSGKKEIEKVVKD
ncbi:MAG: T9SS type A sorting domain-containing protein [Bacteroidota bacterium]|nr:T9SS type A sorting domain-containing protein [Bacteroidota bacterium]